MLVELQTTLKDIWIGITYFNMVDGRFRDAAYFIRILIAVENEFDIVIQDSEVEDINTFEDLIKLIQQKENSDGSRL